MWGGFVTHYKEEHEYREFTGRAEMHKALNSLIGILEGIAIDNEVVALEAQELSHWYGLYRHLINHHPFSEIIPVVDSALADGVLTCEEAEDLRYLCKRLTSKGYYDFITGELQILQGMFHGLLADNVLSDAEILALQSWLKEHEELKGFYPFDEIVALLYVVLEDGVISGDERDLLKAFFAEFIDTRDSLTLDEVSLAELREEYKVQNICAKDPDIVLEGKLFCFTGRSIRGTRDSIEDKIIALGGRFHKDVVKDTDYLVVGAEGSPCWVFACYGRRVEAAIRWRKKGRPMVIVNEYDFWNVVDRQHG